MGNSNQIKAKSLAIKVISYLLPLTAYLIISCTQDGYEKGDGNYSYLRGDFVEAMVGTDKTIISLTTDEGETLPLTQPYSAKWITRPDTVYRCMLYYNKVREVNGQYAAEPISIGDVPCPKVVPLAELESVMKTDPVKFESAWMSKTGKYLNLSLVLMTGTQDGGEATQRLMIVQDTILTNPDATRTCFLRLFHDQGGVPEYYSTHVYASIGTPLISADSVRISINTYKGIIEKAFLLSNP
jgi:hypothetical protein